MNGKRRTASFKKNTFIIKKIDNKSAIDEVAKSFIDPENYLSVNQNVIIGRVIKGPRLDHGKNLIPYSIVGNATLFEEAQNYKINSSNKISSSKFPSSKINSLNTTNISKKESTKVYFDYIDNNRLNGIYTDYAYMKEKNKDKINDFMEKLPIPLKKELKKQEINLTMKKDKDIYSKNLSEFLAQRLNKSEDKLLINRLDEQRFKYEFGELMENESNKEAKAPHFHWIHSLRKTKNNKFHDSSYVNVGGIYNPNWVTIRDKINQSVDFIRKPNSKCTFDLKGICNNRKVKSIINQENSLPLLTDFLTNNHTHNVTQSALYNFTNDIDKSNLFHETNIYNSNTNNYPQINVNITHADHSFNFDPTTNIEVFF